MENFRRALGKSEKVLTMTNNVLQVITGCVLTFIFSMVTLDVFLRYVFNRPLPASQSISELLVGWVIFLPYAYTLLIGGHVRVSLLLVKLPARLQIVADIFVYAVDFIFFALLTYWTWLFFWQSFLEGEIMWAATKLPWWVGKMSMFIGLFFISVTCLYFVLDRVSSLLSGTSNKGRGIV